ncbi:hypothetical protein HN803_04840 [candidate division WWE3 bacterium]|jgi:hypothetical protein|nr:hypothetical protein [candidate division WWE3 bacterium]
MPHNQYRQRQERSCYQPGQKQPFNVSRSKIDMFLGCPRCFYMDRRLGLGKPNMPAFTLNSAVDNLFKNEFDLLRKKGEAHELMKQYKIDAVPFKHKDLPAWRDDYYKYLGANVIHQPTNLRVAGIIDDIWVDPKGNLLIVDYKSTCTTKEINLNDKWKQGYKKQMEIYQWIFRALGFTVSDTGYFVFANGQRNNPKFDGKLEFKLSIIPYQGSDKWIEPVLHDIKDCLESNIIPKPGVDDQGIMCEQCTYKKLSVQTVTRLTQ